MTFSELYYIIISIFTIFFLVQLIQKPALIYLYPYIMSFAFIVFIFPQVIIIHKAEIFKEDSLARLFLMTLLCWIMSFAGWYSFKPANPIFKKTFPNNFNDAKLAIIGAIFIGIGILFNILAYRIIKEEDVVEQASGIVTIYYFFQGLLFLGTGLCLSLWIKNKQRLNLILSIIGLLYGLYIGIILGRRTQTLNTLFLLGLPLYVHYRIKPARIIFIGFILMSFLFVPSIGQYREINKTSKNTSEFLRRLVSEMDFVKNLQEYYSISKSIELANASNVIDFSYNYSDYKFGADYWNRLVFRFVPGQLVGSKAKKEMQINFVSLSARRMRIRDYIPGSTFTGIGDAFSQFDYFGSLFFFFVGVFMRRLWFTVNVNKNPFLQVLYAILLVESILALTHGTTWYLPGFLTVYIFLIVAKQFSKSS